MTADVGDYVEVRWVDSGIHLDEGWAPVEEYIAKAKQQMGEVVTVGVLIDSTPVAVIIGMSVDRTNGTVFGAQVIIRQNISRLTVLA